MFVTCETQQIWTTFYLKFIYSEKASKLCKISTLLLSYVARVSVKSKVKISQNFEAFSEYMNFQFIRKLSCKQIQVNSSSNSRTQLIIVIHVC